MNPPRVDYAALARALEGRSAQQIHEALMWLRCVCWACEHIERGRMQSAWERAVWAGQWLHSIPDLDVDALFIADVANAEAAA